MNSSMSSSSLLRDDDIEPRLASGTAALGNVIISIVGVGILGLPYALCRSGWLLGSASIIFCALLSYYCMILLVKCRSKVTEKEQVLISSYGDLGFNIYGSFGLNAIDTMVLLSQAGGGVAYLIFISENVNSIFFKDGSNKSIILIFIASLQVLLAWVRSLAALAPFSLIGDVANLAAIAIVIKDDFLSFSKFTDVSASKGLSNLPFALSIGCFCYEGFSMTLPLESSMKERSKFPFILALSFSIITFVYVSFGTIGYLAFGESTAEIITLNLNNDWSTVIVKSALCFGIFFTFPVIMHPVHEVFERRVAVTPWFSEHLYPNPLLRSSFLKLLRLLIVMFSAFMAAKVPSFQIIVSLIGSTACSMLAFVFPSLFHLNVFSDELSVCEKALDYCLIVFGIVFAFYGTNEALKCFFG